MPAAPFHLAMPSVRSTSVIFASPHSGRDYPASFLAQSGLDRLAIRSSEDAFVDRLFDICLLYTSPSPRDGLLSRMPSSA